MTTTQGRGAHTGGDWEISHEPPRWIIQARGDIGCKAVAYMVGDYVECAANARLISAAPDLDAAAGLAITALSFEQEKAIERDDPVAYAQITGAKNALIAAQNKVRGRTSEPEMVDITPRAAIAKATGAP